MTRTTTVNVGRRTIQIVWNRYLIGAILVVLATILILVSCGNYEPNQDNQVNLDNIQQCIANGNHPITTQDKDGRVYFIACEPVAQVTP